MWTTFSSCDISERRLRSQCLSNKASLCALGKERTDFVGYDDPKGAVEKAFRALRTLLSLSPASSKAKLLAVTSSVPSEGKSFVALNLALTYTRGGKRVLLVDCDMRRRRLTYLLMADKCEMPGLSNLLAGTVTETVAALTVKPFSDMVLTFPPAGPTPPTPVELLGAESAPAFFAGLESQYDLVIVDAAPVLLVSDLLNLTAVAGMKFLVVDQCLKTEKKQVEETCDTLRRVNAEVVGTVLQQGEKAASESGYSDYGYGYKYGYGYGADREAATKTPWYRRFAFPRPAAVKQAGRVLQTAARVVTVVFLVGAAAPLGRTASAGGEGAGTVG